MDPEQRRREWLERLQAMREIGAIEASDENALIRQYDERAQRLREELARIAPEYLRRVDSDGEDEAKRWLAETAEAMGRRDGEETRQALAAATRNHA
ncbi:hypothetical protein [Lysobacter antibioticus]|uniref:Uncharacterized protein n=1 Tax=Lysobacter antibioticus TaxID=84531 RepID=A0A0S2FBI4_LYSAN|nr:hypothetical protein [Lysobacter antibioticus]ALN80880.1 hypothetical protein LA76x_2750 [Lysobacter antibioticus]